MATLQILSALVHQLSQFARLPSTGGGDGGSPTNPLAPPVLLGVAAIVAGRAARKLRKSERYYVRHQSSSMTRIKGLIKNNRNDLNSRE